MAETFDVIVIGSGPGGYSAAIRCAQKGATIAVVEKGDIGGTCLNRGCIPSKTLLASAHTLLLIKHAAMMGIDVASATPDWSKIQARKDAVVSGFRKGLTGLIKSHKVQILPGRAVVTAPNQIKIETDTTPTQIQAGKIIIATGSQPSQIPTIPFDSQTVISSKEALALEQIPKSMVIIGGGVIGCEMACVYAAMGTKVDIVEALSRLIPMEDQWVGRLMEREFKKLGIGSHTGRKVTSVDKTTAPAQVVQGLNVTVGRSFFKANGRSVAHNETVGEIRAVRDNSTNKIVGITMVGAIVTELIGAARTLIGSTEKITDISFPHPTVSEVLKEAAEDAFGLSLHNPPRA